MNTATLTEIRKSVEAAGGTYKKAKCNINGANAYYINDELMSESSMRHLYNVGVLGDESAYEDYMDEMIQNPADPDDKYGNFSINGR